MIGMIKKLMLLSLALSIGCLSKHSNNMAKEPDKKFIELLCKFDSLHIPFNVIGYCGFSKFNDST